MRRRWVHGRARAVVIVGLVASGCSGSSDSAGSSASPGSSVTSASSAVTSSTSSTTTQVPAPTVTAGIIEVTIAGQVRQVLANGDFVVNDGKVDYTVTMSSSTTILDVNGAPATAGDVQVDGSAQVTGLLSDSTIAAETVTVPTPRVDVPATT